MEELMGAYDQLFSISLAYQTPLAVKAAVKLDLFNIVSQASGNGATLEEILEELRQQNPSDSPQSDRLFRLLKFLVSKKVLSFNQEASRYELNSVSKLLTRNNELFLAPITSFYVSDLVLRPWEHVDAAIKNPGNGIAFRRAHGMDLKDYLVEHPEAGQVIEDFRVSLNQITMATIMQCYQGFNSIKRLIDVGGGQGSFVADVVKRYPHIEGINFDLPQVLPNVSEYPGVKNVPGNALESIPSTDGIFLKNVVHLFNDLEAAKLLSNCFEALEKNGRVIICDMVFDEEDESHLAFDMTTLGGFERHPRNADAWKLILKSAGFESVNFFKICTPFSIIESVKH